MFLAFCDQNYECHNCVIQDIMLNIPCLGLIPMNTKRLLGISLAAAFAISFLGSAYASGYLTIESASVNATPDEIKKAKINTGDKIPKKDAFVGYGVVTSSFSSDFPEVPADVVVATTHPGVLDSEKQKGDIMSPKWHNHYVKIGTGDAGCASGIQVLDISFESPGKVRVHGDSITLRNVPIGDVDAHFGLAPNSLTSFSTGEYAGAVASFTLSGITDEETGLLAVCVDNLTPFVP